MLRYKEGAVTNLLHFQSRFSLYRNQLNIILQTVVYRLHSYVVKLKDGLPERDSPSNKTTTKRTKKKTKG